MTVFHAIILGIVEGITEFLPISSTGHLIIASHFLGLENTEFLKTFEIAIQCGAILSIPVFFWRTLVGGREVWKKILLGFVPTAIIGVTLYPIIKTYLMGSIEITAYALVIGGVIIILMEMWYEKRKKGVAVSEISYGSSVMLGLFQSIALVPGVSRSGATIVGGLGMGIDRAKVVEFSFLLALPTMVAATALDLSETAASFSGAEYMLLLVGGAVSFVVALFSTKLLLLFVKRHSLTVFGVYRICAGVAILLLL